MIKIPDSPVTDEVIIRDCYRAKTIPKGSNVIDIGAFHGEFCIMCADMGHVVEAYEPNKKSFTQAKLNAENSGVSHRIIFRNWAILERNGACGLLVPKDHPAGSFVVPDGSIICKDINEIIPDNAAVKIDAEGSEAVMFSDPSWLERVVWLSMEWHNRDARHYERILCKFGFYVQIEGHGGVEWEPSMSGGLIHARR